MLLFDENVVVWPVWADTVLRNKSNQSLIACFNRDA